MTIRTIIIISCMLMSMQLFAQKINEEDFKQSLELFNSDSLKNRTIGSEVSKLAANYMEESFKSIGLKPWDGKYSHAYSEQIYGFTANGTNVIGLVESANENYNKEYIVLAAPLDVVNNAETNPSYSNQCFSRNIALASLIEMAKYFQANKDKLKRSMIIAAFDGESNGYLGTKHYPAYEHCY